MNRVIDHIKLPFTIVITALITYLWLNPGKNSRYIEPIENFEVDLNLPHTRPVYSSTGPNGMYLDLLKLSLVDFLYETDPKARAVRFIGKDWPSRALTMVGLPRLDNIQELTEIVLRENIPGDLIEAGAWRGGATIFMRGLLKAHGIRDRNVWVADSFEGLPPPDLKNYPQDYGSDLHMYESLPVSIEIVRNNFERYGLLDEQVKFLKGWFKDTLPNAPIDKLAILRIDADMYESTMDALKHLYPKLSPGG